MSDHVTSWLERMLGAGPRAARTLRDELGEFFPRKILAETLSRLLPQLTLARTRTLALRAAGVRIGARSLVLGPVRLTGIGNPCRHLSIGDDTIITGPLHADLGAAVRIGNRVRIGHEVSLLTVSHAMTDPDMRSGESMPAPIEIGDGTWIASRAIVLPGVSIGAGCVVAAGAVVTRDVPPHSLMAGVPARLVRELPRKA
jgi:acetyltransferase-like isoleucine patch superfamily enzyme